MEGLGDIVVIRKFSERIRVLKHEPTKYWPAWFEKRCEIKRISNETGKLFNHTKAYCIDLKLLYIGSDNCYPNYNEEFGVWVEDEHAIKEWYDHS